MVGFTMSGIGTAIAAGAGLVMGGIALGITGAVALWTMRKTSGTVNAAGDALTGFIPGVGSGEGGDV